MSSDVVELLLKQQADQQALADRIADAITGPSLEDYAARERALLDELREVRAKAQARAALEYAVKVARDTATWLGGQVVAARERREPTDAAEALAATNLMRDYPPPNPPTPPVLTGGHPVVPDRVVATHGPTGTAPDGSLQSPNDPKGKRR